MTEETTPVPAGGPPAVRLLRVGTAERTAAVSALGEHYAAGRLDTDELDQRVTVAHAARTRVDLETLFADLPEPAPFRRQPAGWSDGPPVGWSAGRAARERGRRLPRTAFLPVVPLLLIVLVGVSVFVGFPVFPLFFLFWWGIGRRAWR